MIESGVDIKREIRIKFYPYVNGFVSCLAGYGLENVPCPSAVQGCRQFGSWTCEPVVGTVAQRIFQAVKGE